VVIQARELVDMERGVVDRRIFSDAKVYQQELEQIFGRAWLFIGHDSLVPNPNDFFLTYMGEDPVILTRDAKGEVHAFLNMCMHRGNRVARADDGNAKNFMCTYHGWTYSNEGKLVSVPGLQEAYYGELDVDKLGLVSVAQIDTYAGLIFATWDAEAPGLEDYLGDTRWYMDMMFNRREGGVELIGPDKWIIPTNWKLPVDNFSGDNYHVAVTHRSATLARAKALGREAPDPGASFASAGAGVSPGNGHGVAVRILDTDADRNRAAAIRHPVLMKYEEDIRPEVERRLGSFRANVLAPVVSSVFPNMSFLFPSVNGTVRMWHPRTPEYTEVWAFVAVDKAMPEEVRDVFRIQSMLSFATSGMLEQDDMDNWRQCTLSGKSLTGRRFSQDLTMGVGKKTTHDVMPGNMVLSNIQEGTQRGVYEWWQQMINAKSWKDLPVAPRTAKYEGTATFKG
jgi:phenylpropionate dioxygenase-like ring-hydroxylating dioxygenase large terminal subunit